MRSQKASAVPLLAPLLFSTVIIALAGDFLGPEGCTPSSCGNLGSISYPFRLKTDPANCGDARYEFACVDNETVLEYQSSKYHVTDILYGSSLIQVVDAGFASAGSCGLPSRSLPPGATQLLGQYYGFRTNGWASFVRCSKEIKYETYREVPCLTRNGTFVYVVSGYQVMYLAPSCGFLSMIPVLDDEANITSQTDVFKLLNKGFLLYWSVGKLTTSGIVRNCANDSIGMFKELIRSKKFLSKVSSLVKSQMHFLACLEDYSGVEHIEYVFHLAIAIMVLVEIAQLVIVLAILARFVIAPMVIFAFLCRTLRSMLASVDVVEKFLRNQQTLSPTRYAYADIIGMTNHFKVKLGQGGFGSVFKGTLPGGHLVAVKMLGNSKCNGEEFISEVSTIGRIHHHNVVRLIGYCSDGSNRALVYEYMPNGSLDKYIFSSNPTYRPFSLEKLNEIALGVARGIDYLHRGCDMTILHFDIKPHNILLDRNFAPKVSDFGLAKLYPKDYSMVCLSAARGTTGYIAPELISRNFGVVSYKSDVYSYGMLLMEMAGGRRNVDTRAGGSSRAYYHWWIYDRLRQDGGGGGVKIDDSFEIGDVERKLCIVGLWCIQIKPSDRPSMGEVIEMLEAEVEDLQMPPKPFLSSPDPPNMEMESSMNSSLTELSSVISGR